MSLDYFRSARILLGLQLVLAFFLSNVYFYTAAASETPGFTGINKLLTAKPMQASVTGKIFDSVLAPHSVSEAGPIGQKLFTDHRPLPDRAFSIPDQTQGFYRVPVLRKAHFGQSGQRLFAVYCSWKIPGCPLS